MTAFWVDVAILTVVSMNLALLGVIFCIARISMRRHEENQNLICNIVKRLSSHEEEEANNWLAFTDSIKGSFDHICKWQKMTAKLMHKDTKDLATHDSNVSELLVEAKLIRDELAKLAGRPLYKSDESLSQD